MSQTHKILTTIILIGCGLRLFAIFYSPNEFVFSDSTSYDKIAHNILLGKGFAETPALQAVRPPVYSLFLALIYSFTTNLLIVKLIQVVIGCCSIYLVFILANQLLKNPQISLMASFLFAIDPLQIAFCALVLTETLFCFLFLYSLSLLFTTRETNSQKSAIYLGITCAIASLLRSVMLPFVAFIGLIWVWQKRQQWKLVMLCWVTLFLTMSPWILRNAFIFKDFIPTTTKTGVNLYEALGPEATGGPMMLKMKLPTKYRELNEIQRDKFLRSETWKWIKENPTRPISLAFVKFFRLWNLGFNDNKLQNLKYINHALVLYSAILYACFLCGTFILTRNHFFYLVTPIVYISLIHMVFLGSIRYRVPVLACIDIIAATAIVALISQYKKYRSL